MQTKIEKFKNLLRDTMRLIVFIKKECYYTTTVGANESRIKLTECSPTCASQMYCNILYE